MHLSHEKSCVIQKGNITKFKKNLLNIPFIFVDFTHCVKNKKNST